MNKKQLSKAELDNFISLEERYPVIATTSKLLNTGVDVQTCHLIVAHRLLPRFQPRESARQLRLAG